MPFAALKISTSPALQHKLNVSAPVGVWVNDASAWVSVMPSLTSTCLFPSQSDLTGVQGVSWALHHDEDYYSCCCRRLLFSCTSVNLGPACFYAKLLWVSWITEMAGPIPHFAAYLWLQLCCSKWKQQVQSLMGTESEKWELASCSRQITKRTQATDFLIVMCFSAPSTICASLQ